MANTSNVTPHGPLRVAQAFATSPLAQLARSGRGFRGDQSGPCLQIARHWKKQLEASPVVGGRESELVAGRVKQRRDEAQQRHGEQAG